MGIKWDEVKRDEKIFADFNDTIIAVLPELVHEKAGKIAAFLADDAEALQDFGEVLIALNGQEKRGKR